MKMNKEIQQKIKGSATRLLPEVISIRRDIHQHPELSFSEKNTSEKIQTFLKAKGIPFTTGWAGYGIVAHIDGSSPGSRVMFRADMDALPINEKTDVPFQSTFPGIMHACGHDAHTASLLGVAAIVQENRDQLKGTAQFIFQPGEEKLPGGASIMIKEGLFEKNNTSWIAAQHVFPPLPAGHVGFRNGLYMASADEIYISIIGKGGHAATPHLCIDPIPVSARIISALQELISRTLDPALPGVLTIGKIFTDGGATNVIPDRVHLEGTLRAMDEDWRRKTHERLVRLVNDICHAAGAKGDVRIEIGYPCLNNHDEVTDLFRNKAIEFLGEEFVHELPLRLASEDFAFYSQKVPATFYRLGTGFAGKENPSVHSNNFDIDESALETGIGLMAYVALTHEG
jgi:amidohydrolase